jgi:hypothetical protein
MAQLNTYSDISSIAPNIQEDAIFVIRELGLMQSLVKTFRDATGANPRVGYTYNQGTVTSLAETDDLTSSAFTPSADQTLTPAEIGLQFFVTDLRAATDAPEDVISDGGLELGMAAADKIETDLLGDLASLTGGTVGTAGSTITWGYLSAAIARARNANKSNTIPLNVVLHGYQWEVLSSSATIAGATVAATAPGFQEELTRSGFVATYSGARIYQVWGGLVSTNFTGGVFPRDAIAIDWRRGVRVEPERDASRRGTEFNMSAVYAHGIWRPSRGVQFVFDASAPTS